MGIEAPPLPRILLLAAFVAVTSAAGLQWIGVSAQAEATRQKDSRQTLSEFSALLTQYDHAAPNDRPAVAAHLTGMAEQFANRVKEEPLKSASRRVVALASYEADVGAREGELRERLRAELRGLVNEAESLESAALWRASWLAVLNGILLFMATLFCGLLTFQVVRPRSKA